MKSKRLHYYSGIFIIVFILIHLCNHLISLWGAETHISTMNLLRVYYRNPFIESILLVCISLQIITGIKLARSLYKTNHSFFDKIKILSGLYLAFFFVIHLSAVFTGRYLLGLDTNFYFGVAGLNTFPLNLFFIPYYGIAIISFFGHMAAVHNKKMKIKFLSLSVTQQSFFILFTGLIIATICLYGLTGGFRGIEIPTEYKIIKD